MLDGQAEEPVEGLDEIDVHELRLAVPFNTELVLVGITEAIDIQKRLAAPALHVEHVRQDVLLADLGVSVEQRGLFLRPLQFEVVEGVLVGFELTTFQNTLRPSRPTGLPSLQSDE